MENPNPNPEYIITMIAIAHGTVINLNVVEDMNNTRIYSLAGDFGCVELNGSLYSRMKNKIYKKFRSPIEESTTKNLMNELCIELTNMYNLNHKKTTSDECKNIYENITIDKCFFIEDGFSAYFPPYISNGAHIVSIHKKSGNIIEQIYPVPTLYQPPFLPYIGINLFNIKELESFARFFKKTLPDINSKEFPNIYDYNIETQRLIEQQRPSLSDLDSQKFKDVREKIFFEQIVPEWDIQINNSGKNIVAIRLSKLLKIIKEIVGESCKINLFDFSCNPESLYSIYNSRSLKQYYKPLINGDIEMGIKPLDFGGNSNKAKTKRKKQNKKYKNKKTKTKTKKYKK